MKRICYYYQSVQNILLENWKGPFLRRYILQVVLDSSSQKNTVKAPAPTTLIFGATRESSSQTYLNVQQNRDV